MLKDNDNDLDGDRRHHAIWMELGELGAAAETAAGNTVPVPFSSIKACHGGLLVLSSVRPSGCRARSRCSDQPRAILHPSRDPGLRSNTKHPARVGMALRLGAFTDLNHTWAPAAAVAFADFRAFGDCAMNGAPCSAHAVPMPPRLYENTRCARARRQPVSEQLKLSVLRSLKATTGTTENDRGPASCDYSGA